MGNNDNNINNNLDFLDLLGLFTGALSVLNYGENLKQTSNNILEQELHEQNEKYLKQILNRLDKIEDRLNKIQGGN